MGLVRLRFALLAVVLGCGLRSDPIFQGDTDLIIATEGDTETETDTDPPVTSDSGDFPPPMEGRLGSCTNPIVLPTTDSSASGELRGPGLYTTDMCGTDDGLEDVYTFTPMTASDVTITFDPIATDFDPIVRVTQGGCEPGVGAPRVCGNDYFAGGDIADPRHFFTVGGQEYSIHIDSANGGGGNYAFSLTLGEPPLSQCDVHPELIFQVAGSSFQWQNDFDPGQGRVDSQCGGIGPENFFQVQTTYPGTMFVDVFGSAGFRPVVALRTGCGALTELECATEATLGTPGLASMAFFVPSPGTYYLDVDTLDLNGGVYDLTVSFD